MPAIQGVAVAFGDTQFSSIAVFRRNDEWVINGNSGQEAPPHRVPGSTVDRPTRASKNQMGA